MWSFDFFSSSHSFPLLLLVQRFSCELMLKSEKTKSKRMKQTPIPSQGERTSPSVRFFFSSEFSFSLSLIYSFSNLLSIWERNEKFLAIFRATQPSKVIDIVWWQKEHISIIFLFETEMPFDRKGFQNGLCLYRTDPKTNTEIFICHSIYVWLLWLPKVFGHCITFAVNSMESSSLHSVFLISCFQSIKKQNERRRNQFQFTMHALKQICSAMMMPNDELLHDHENLWRKKQNYINIIMRFC